MQLRRLKVLISWFFLMVLASGMADFSLHALIHKHAQSHESNHSLCANDLEIQAGVSTILNSEQECLRCGQFLVHTAWAVANLVSVQTLNYSELPVVYSYCKLISNKLPSVFLRGPPEA